MNNFTAFGGCINFLSALMGYTASGRAGGRFAVILCDDPGFSDTGGGRIMVPSGGPKDESFQGRSVADAAGVF